MYEVTSSLGAWKDRDPALIVSWINQKLWTDLDEILCMGLAWPKDEMMALILAEDSLPLGDSSCVNCFIFARWQACFRLRFKISDCF